MALDKPNRLTASATRINSGDTGVSDDVIDIVNVIYEADLAAIGQGDHIQPVSWPRPGRIPFV